MSIYSIQNNYDTSLIQSLSLTNESEKTGQSKMPPPPPPPGDGKNMLASAVSDFASAQGLDDETIAQLESDLEAALSDIFNSDQSATGDIRAQVDEAVASVLESYGLDSEEFTAQMPAGPPPPPPPNGGPVQAATDYARSQGLDDETVKQLKTELENELSGLLEESDDEKVSREAMDAVITKVFEKYGLDSSAFFDQMASSAPSADLSGFGQNNSELFSLLDRQA